MSHYSSKRPPNIVFIMADQLGAKTLNCYGGGVDSSPTLDRLASHGMVFSRCYATHPVCAPNRATILTGRSADVHGVVKNNLVLQPDQLTYTQMLQQAGYHTGGFGKFHHDPMHLPPPENYTHLGYDETVITEDSKLGAWLDWIRKEHPEHYETALAVSWPMPWSKSYGDEREDVCSQILDARKWLLEPVKALSDWELMYPSPLPKELHQTTFITNVALDFMARHLQEHSGRPFFTFVSYVDPHDPYDPPVPYDSMFSVDQMPEPIPPAQTPLSIEALEVSRDFMGFRSISMNPRCIQRLRSLYHGSLRFIDDQIGRLVGFLEGRNLTDNTIVVFTTDHGEMLGDHGLITKGVKHYDAGIRCPLIVSGAGIMSGETDRLVSSLDFFPTLCDWAGITKYPPLEGISFARDAAGDPAARPDAVLVQARHEPKGAQALSLITDDGWRLTQYDHPVQAELFNLKNDPDEQHNLYRDPAYADSIRQLQERRTVSLMRRIEVDRRRNFAEVDGKKMIFSSEPWELEPDGLD